MKRAHLVVLLAALLLRPPQGYAAPAVDLETHVALKIEALSVGGDEAAASQTSGEVEVGPSAPAGVDLVLPWGKGKATATVHFTGRLGSVTENGEAVLYCEASTRANGRPPVVASREIRLAAEGSALFEVFGDGDRRIVLTLHGEQVRRAVVRPRVVLGPQVRFSVAVERVDGDRIVLLETNELHTFVGQSVEYSFRFGQNEGLESVRLSLLPVSLTGDLVTIEAEINGALPSASGTVLLSRTEKIVASRKATSHVAATTGTPPAGYQFQVTPDF